MTDGGDPRLSVVVPTLNEAATLPRLLSDLSVLDLPYEVVVADGGSTDATRDVAMEGGARVMETRAGRGLQLRAGAEAARAPMLCFLHADVRLDRLAATALARAVRLDSEDAYAFRLRIAGRGWRYRFVEMGGNLRSRIAGVPYGDQGLLVRRAEYEQAGGYPPIPLMEDVALVRSLRRITRIRILDAAVEVSPRRWERDGVLRRMIRNWTLVARYLLGAPPARLAARYKPETVGD